MDRLPLLMNRISVQTMGAVSPLPSLISESSSRRKGSFLEIVFSRTLLFLSEVIHDYLDACADLNLLADLPDRLVGVTFRGPALKSLNKLNAS
jgi:hypothetical protein